MQNENISLYFSEGSSDKEYHAELLAKDSGFVVNYRNGKRGSTLRAGTRTKSPVPYAKAKEVYDSVVKEKLGKGYSPGETGAAYQSTPLEARFSGIRPQLLNAIEDDEVDNYLRDDNWAAQQKMDGKRGLIRVAAGNVEGINRKGLVIALPQIVVDEITGLNIVQFIADGELVGTTYYVFDLLELAGEDLRDQSFRVRDQKLYSLLGGTRRSVVKVPTYSGTLAKQELFNQVRARGGEGVVFKRFESCYRAGRPNSGGDQLKYKFLGSATCRVLKVNASKRSVAIELPNGTGEWVGVGNVTIPPDQSIPKKGTLIEVEYLYAYRGGSLFQPTCKGVRDDVPATTLAELKYKGEGESSEDDEA